MNPVRIQIASDLHLDYNGPATLKPEDIVGDILVLAGDIDTDPNRLTLWLQDLTDKPVVIIAGNHEHWGRIAEDVADIYGNALAHRPRTYFLNDQTFTSVQETSVVIPNPPNMKGVDETVVTEHREIKFYGSTLWTGQDAEPCWFIPNDLREIASEEGFGDHYVINFMKSSNDRARKFFEDELYKKRTDGEVRICVSHHAPTFRSESPYWHGSTLSGCFYNDEMNDLINLSDIWIHGHTHESKDYMFDNHARIICNPHGYGKENEKGFQKSLIVEV